jgi:antirestriction protein ArdC
MRKEKKNVYQIVNDLILEKLQEGTLPWRQTWTSYGPPRNYISKKPYRGFNSILLNSLQYEYPLYMTFNQAKENGGFIKKGSTGIPVIYWKILHYSESGKKIDPNELSKHDPGKVNTVPLLRYYTVFNIQDVEGIIPDLPGQYIPNDPISACEQIVSDMNNPPEIIHKGDQAYYQLSKDLICLPVRGNFSSSEEYYSTLFHELSHSTGHPLRLNRKSLTESNAFGSKLYSFEELIAEISACFLCNEAGIDYQVLDNSAAYINSWLKILIQEFREDQTCFVKASAKAQAATDFILNRNSPNEDLKDIIQSKQSAIF